MNCELLKPTKSKVLHIFRNHGNLNTYLHATSAVTKLKVLAVIIRAMLSHGQRYLGCRVLSYVQQ